MEKLLVSACLLGVNCRYDGGNCHVKSIERLRAKYELIPVCPETLGTLPIPRTPSERLCGKVVNKLGLDVSAQFGFGASQALKIAKENHVHKALLKEKSPSCGTHRIHDGTFTGHTIEGMGVTAELLRNNGISVFSEDQIEELL